MTGTDWMDFAACSQLDLPDVVIDEMFFPTPGGSAAAAKRVCATCPVIRECLAWALGRGTTLAGVWGATSEHDRRRILANRNPEAPPPRSKGARYTHAQRAEAVALYHSTRHMYANNSNAIRAVADARGIGDRQTLIKWIQDAEAVEKATAAP